MLCHCLATNIMDNIKVNQESIIEQIVTLKKIKLICFLGAFLELIAIFFMADLIVTKADSVLVVVFGQAKCYHSLYIFTVIYANLLINKDLFQSTKTVRRIALTAMSAEFIFSITMIVLMAHGIDWLLLYAFGMMNCFLVSVLLVIVRRLISTFASVNY